MSRVDQIGFDNIVPGEDGVQPSQLASIIKSHMKGEPVPPVPVRQLGNRYVNLDGRHRLIYSYLQEHEQVQAFIANDRDDHMYSSQFPQIPTAKLRDNNVNIAHRWYDAVQTAQHLSCENYHEHIQRLRSNHAYLQSLETCIDYLQGNHL